MAARKVLVGKYLNLFLYNCAAIRNSHCFNVTSCTGGGSGFIGEALCKSLRKRGYETILLSRTPGHSKITWVLQTSQFVTYSCR